MLMDEKIHTMLKSYCVEHGLVMKVLVEKLIVNEVTQNHHNQTTIVKKYPSYEG
jgi:hypothetical protein